MFDDPGRVNLRKAARAAIVVPILFALLVSAGNERAALYGAFGSFAALAFADFGGSLAARFGAYVGLLVLGAGLVALGTLVNGTTVLAVLAMLVVGFALLFAGALGGYWAAGATASMLAFVLAVMSDAPISDLGSSELGWVLGVAVAGISAVLLWPVHQRQAVRAAASRAARLAGRCVDPAAPAEARTAAAAELHAAVGVLRSRAGIVYRPAGSQARERALVALVVALPRLPRVIDQLESGTSAVNAQVTAQVTAQVNAQVDARPEQRALAAAVSETFATAADVLDGRGPPAVDLTPLTAARDRHTDALSRWATARLSDGNATPTHVQQGASEVLARFDDEFPLRRLSLLAGAIAADAATAAGRHYVLPPGAPLPEELGAGPDSRRADHAVAVLRAHWSLHSVRFRNAARAGIGLAIAVLVAKVASLDHAFWAVLGTLTVLRSTALGTGTTALQAIGGSLIGFAVAASLMLTVGSDERALWVLLPIVVFLSAFTPGAVNLVVGQASFTVFVVVLFNILVPEGWRTGLVRVEDVAIGAGISVVVGLLLWPRGARGVASASFADLLRAEGAHLAAAVDAAFGRVSRAEAATVREQAVGARGRAVAALEDLNVEHGGGRVDRETWIGMLARATLVQVAGEGIERTSSIYGTVPACAAAQHEVDAAVGVIRQTVGDAADQLVATGAGTSPAVTPPAVAPASASMAATPGLAECLTTHADALGSAVALVWVHEYLLLADDALTRA